MSLRKICRSVIPTLGTVFLFWPTHYHFGINCLLAQEAANPKIAELIATSVSSYRKGRTDPSGVTYKHIPELVIKTSKGPIPFQGLLDENEITKLLADVQKHFRSLAGANPFASTPLREDTFELDAQSLLALASLTAVLETQQKNETLITFPEFLNLNITEDQKTQLTMNAHRRKLSYHFEAEAAFASLARFALSDHKRGVVANDLSTYTTENLIDKTLNKPNRVLAAQTAIEIASINNFFSDPKHFDALSPLLNVIAPTCQLDGSYDPFAYRCMLSGIQDLASVAIFMPTQALVVLDSYLAEVDFLTGNLDEKLEGKDEIFSPDRFLNHFIRYRVESFRFSLLTHIFLADERYKGQDPRSRLDESNKDILIEIRNLAGIHSGPTSLYSKMAKEIKKNPRYEGLNSSQALTLAFRDTLIQSDIMLHAVAMAKLDEIQTPDEYKLPIYEHLSQTKSYLEAILNEIESQPALDLRLSQESFLSEVEVYQNLAEAFKDMLHSVFLNNRVHHFYLEGLLLEGDAEGALRFATDAEFLDDLKEKIGATAEVRFHLLTHFAKFHLLLPSRGEWIAALLDSYYEVATLLEESPDRLVYYHLNPANEIIFHRTAVDSFLNYVTIQSSIIHQLNSMNIQPFIYQPINDLPKDLFYVSEEQEGLMLTRDGNVIKEWLLGVESTIYSLSHSERYLAKHHRHFHSFPSQLKQTSQSIQKEWKVFEEQMLFKDAPMSQLEISDKVSDATFRILADHLRIACYAYWSPVNSNGQIIHNPQDMDLESWKKIKSRQSEYIYPLAMHKSAQKWDLNNFCVNPSATPGGEIKASDSLQASIFSRLFLFRTKDQPTTLAGATGQSFLYTSVDIAKVLTTIKLLGGVRYVALGIANRVGLGGVVGGIAAKPYLFYPFNTSLNVTLFLGINHSIDYGLYLASLSSGYNIPGALDVPWDPADGWGHLNLWFSTTKHSVQANFVPAFMIFSVMPLANNAVMHSVFRRQMALRGTPVKGKVAYETIADHLKTCTKKEMMQLFTYRFLATTSIFTSFPYLSRAVMPALERAYYQVAPGEYKDTIRDNIWQGWGDLGDNLSHSMMFSAVFTGMQARQEMHVFKPRGAVERQSQKPSNSKAQGRSGTEIRQEIKLTQNEILKKFEGVLESLRSQPSGRDKIQFEKDIFLQVNRVAEKLANSNNISKGESIGIFYRARISKDLVEYRKWLEEKNPNMSQSEIGSQLKHREKTLQRNYEKISGNYDVQLVWE
jgi:hypothetical protein